MKKRLFFALALSAFMIASCNKQEVSSENKYASAEALSYSEYVPESTSIDETVINDEVWDYDSIKVNPVTNLVNDFAFGADLSAVAEVEANGGVYYGKDGKPGDVFQILAAGGVNYCRLRIWNDPYSSTMKDANGNGLPYGGGTNDLATDIYLAKRAQAAGMKILLDFHYSDSWADPAKFFSPKAWRYNVMTQIPELLGDYTAGTLRAFKDAGVTIDAVQIGNEENTGLAGYRFIEASEGIAQMVKAGVEASKGVFPNIKTLIHLTNIKTRKSCQNFMKAMADGGVDYDIVGLSYYPFWHGAKSNLTWMMEYIKDTYNKPSWVVETSYGFTDEDAVYASNQYGSHLENAGGYLTSWQGQTTAIRDIVQTIANAKENCGQGCFYWEPAWLPVEGSTWATPSGQYYNEHGVDPYNYKQSASYKAGAIVAYNGEIYTAKEAMDPGPWDESKWTLTYDAKSCRSAWANQGWFSYSGKALPSIDTYKLIKDGSKAATETIQGIRESEIEVTINLKEGKNLPTTALVTSDFAALREAPVTWTQSDIDAITRDGNYIVNGVVTSGEYTYPIVAKVIAQTNWVSDYSFEEQAEGEQVAVREPWEVTSNVASGARIEAKSEGNLDGNKYFHWYSASENTWELSQTVTGVPSGTYDLAARMMAGDMKSNYKIFDLWYELNDGPRVTQSVLNSVLGYGSPLSKYMVRIAIENIVLTGENNKIKIGLYCEQGASAWGHCDVWSFSEHVEGGESVETMDTGWELASSIGAASPWILDSNSGAMAVVDNSGGDAVGSPSTCSKEVHYYSGSEFDFAFHKDYASLEAGTYTLGFYMQTVAANHDKFEIYYKVGDGEEVVIDALAQNLIPAAWASSAPYVTISGINVASAGKVTLGFRVEGKAGCWGHFTDLSLLAA